MVAPSPALEVNASALGRIFLRRSGASVLTRAVFFLSLPELSSLGKKSPQQRRGESCCKLRNERRRASRCVPSIRPAGGCV